MPTPDLTQYAWSGLRRYQNVSFVEETLMALHGARSAQRPNVRKQATQIRYCLIQAKEYFDAAGAATLATKPNLLYYSAMSLVLAEILYKQDGRSSLDKAREDHAHHGLELKVSQTGPGEIPLSQSAASLRAKPLIHSNGEAFGTFELWHRTAREMPMVGAFIEYHNAGTNVSGYRPILTGSDNRLPRIPNNGLSFLECVASIPGMEQFVTAHGVRPTTIRGRINQGTNQTDNSQNTSITVHPGDNELITQFFENMVFHPAGVDRITLTEMPSGGILHWRDDPTNFGFVRYVPPGSNLTEIEIRFWPNERPLNEFGYLYVALYIAGNYARYYPDKWMMDVERATPLALAVEELIGIVTSRIALLTLSELSRSYVVAKA